MVDLEKESEEKKMYSTPEQRRLSRTNIHEEMLIEIQENPVRDKKYSEEHPWTAYPD